METSASKVVVEPPLVTNSTPTAAGAGDVEAGFPSSVEEPEESSAALDVAPDS